MAVFSDKVQSDLLGWIRMVRREHPELTDVQFLKLLLEVIAYVAEEIE